MSTALSGFVASGVDTSSTAKSKDVIESSDSEPVVEAGVLNAIDYGNRLGENWAEREKRDGVEKWYCPFEPAGASRQLFDSKKECQAYINTSFKMRVAQAKLEKKPKEAYTPQRTVLSPKRTLADFVLPEHADKYMAAQRAAMEVQGLGQVARDLASKDLTAGVLVRMMESQAVLKVRGLGDDELVRTLRAASNHSKRKLLRACQQEVANRKLKFVA